MTEIIAWLILDLLAFYGLYRLLKLAVLLEQFAPLHINSV